MIYCKIENGVVTNRAEFDGEMPTGWGGKDNWVADEVAHIGWLYRDGAFVAPQRPPVTPIIPALGADPVAARLARLEAALIAKRVIAESDLGDKAIAGVRS